jgi:hypothetical protein
VANDDAECLLEAPLLEVKKPARRRPQQLSLLDNDR